MTNESLKSFCKLEKNNTYYPCPPKSGTYNVLNYTSVDGTSKKECEGVCFSNKCDKYTIDRDGYCKIYKKA